MSGSNIAAETGSTTASQVAWWIRCGVFCLLTILLAWAPFPLGSAVSWGAPLLELMVAAIWLLWTPLIVLDARTVLADLRAVAVPAMLVILVLAWAVVQTLPLTPSGWAHPLWSLTAQALHAPLLGIVSIDAWRTESEALKLACYAMTFWLVFSLARRPDAAGWLLNAVIAITAAYAAYGFVLAVSGFAQAGLIYSVPFKPSYISGPFMLHNSFATYEGLGTLAAIVKLFDLGRESIVWHRGPRPLASTALQFAFGGGGPLLLAVLLDFAAVIASASRAGFVSTVVALVVTGTLFAVFMRSLAMRNWAFAAVFVALLMLLAGIMFGGQTLGERLTQLIDSGAADARPALWDAAWRMIADAPWRGLGLGTYQDAYPLYAQQTMPYVMDKAHCDYLEFAAGLGLPAAIAWWVALLYLAMLCLRGYLRRRRDRHFPLLGFGAVVLVAVHASVDFSLQLPAVGLLFAAIFGLAVAQSRSMRAAAG